MDIVPIFKMVIDLDVHQAQFTDGAIIEQSDGSLTQERREFGGFKRDRKRWPSGRAHLARISWSWRAPAFTGRVRMRHSKAWVPCLG